tara:strand:+ start:6637 stop:8682 length:2046 start_codon:yes stop_codon:yes gene_type:complete
MADDDILEDAKEAFTRAEDAESENRKCYEDDIRFARHEEQWDAKVARQLEAEGRPMLTISKMNAFIRQVVNDARQNKPSIRVHPADSGADPETADVINGLIRNIEYTSNADVAYDTAVDCAVSGGFGYWRVGLDYAYSDSFDMDLSIERIANPLSVYGDPNSMAADSSDWMTAHVVDEYTKDQFKAKWGRDTKTISEWDNGETWDDSEWKTDNTARVAEWWKREEVDVLVQQFANPQTGQVYTYSADDIENDADIAEFIGVLEFKRERTAKTYKVMQYWLSGAEILGDPVEWPGCYIPIVPVYGDEYNIKGKRYFRSLIHSAKSAQQMFNVWRSKATEVVAMSPRVPYIGRKGTFDSDIERWQTANSANHPFLEYDNEMPQRQPLDSGPAIGAMQEALSASDDMKAVIGLYDASLGARSNETSGRAIMARQREGDVSTFHFVDNLNRAIRHTGRILIDAIPKVYTGERIIRVMGEDGTPENKPLNQEYPQTDPKTGENEVDEMGQAIMAMHDFSAGKYDLTVTTGPSFTTRREEAAFQMTEMMRALPASAPVLGKHLAKNMDWPGADDIAEELEAMGKPPEIPPEMQQMIEQGKQKLAEQEQTIQQLKQDQAAEMAKVEAGKQQAMIQVQADEEIERIKIASNERIAQMKIDSEERVAAYKARLTAQANQQASIYLQTDQN